MKNWIVTGLALASLGWFLLPNTDVKEREALAPAPTAEARLSSESPREVARPTDLAVKDILKEPSSAPKEVYYEDHIATKELKADLSTAQIEARIKSISTFIEAEQLYDKANSDGLTPSQKREFESLLVEMESLHLVKIERLLDEDQS